MREALAALAHEQWSGWMRYMFGKCQSNEDGSITIPAGYARALLHQINTPYAELSEAEKNSDREEADRVMACISEQMRHLPGVKL